MATTLNGHFLHRLEGGAQVVTAPMADRMSASLVVLFAVGSRYEDDRIGGISHFVEHLIFKGTEKRPTAKDIAEAIEGVGGVMNAFTDKEVTGYWTRVPADQLELATDVLFDMISHSRFTPADIDRERMVILEELKMDQDQPQDYVHALFDEIMWPGHPLGRQIIGTTESVSSLERDQLIDYVQAHYRQANIVVGTSGGIDVDRALNFVGRNLDLPAEKNGALPSAAPPAVKEQTVLLHKKDTEQAHICLGTRSLSYLDPDRYALDLLNTVLGEGMSSRLFLEIREKRGLAYDVHSYTSKHHDAGSFAVYMGVDPNKAEEGIAAVVRELRRVCSEEVPPAELQKVKEYTKGRLRLGLESTNAMASWLSQQQLLTGRIRTVDEVVAEVDAVTVDDMKRVARRVLGEPIQMSVIGPFQDDSGLTAALDG